MNLAAACLALLAAGPLGAAEPRAFEVSADGREVLSRADGLVWERCAVGSLWNGLACTGEPARLDHAGALAAARARGGPPGNAWRLPRAPELQRWAQRLARDPAGAHAAFPQNPEGPHWSASVRIEAPGLNPYAYANIQKGLGPEGVNQIGFLHGLAVDSAGGEVLMLRKTTPLPVRLVRPGSAASAAR